MPIPEQVLNLIKTFATNIETYRDPEQYNEARLRIEFLDPLFAALGWDMANASGNADAYKDVVHEDALKIAGAGTKAPDYCFRIGSTRKFFLEAKKPSVHIKGDPAPAYQLRRYAWSAKLPISVLSDFEEFAIYDTRIKPAATDKPSVARIFYCTYDEFPRHWDYIVSILSKDAVWKGSFDKYAESAKSKRGTTEVDDAFLVEIESWRIDLAQNLALRNPKLSERDLNSAVTKTIDRIVFLRICEDRGIEPYLQLQIIAKVQNDIYGELLKLFRRADEKYNSGLFHFSKESGRDDEPDTLTPSLDIDDKILRPILASLYYPDCPYEFSVLPADILGHVYEQFLGKVIRLTAGHRAKVEEKPEVRKAGGVYYTPTYIVQYIVQNAVGKLVENKTPREVAKLTILDPACGSGSFLLDAYQSLLDWHLLYYTSHNPDQFLKQKSPPICPTTKSPGTESLGYRLTLTERKRILIANIYGVDIDQNAVETTKLSLLLKALEGESSETIANQLKLFHRERALPDLAANIKCGNSLIAPDFYHNGQLMLLRDEEASARINAFDWKLGFPRIAKSAGFDAVIGNPPWGVDFSPAEIGYLRDTYETPSTRFLDSYAIFIECALKRLKPDGRLGYIIPDTWLRKDDHLEIRKFLLSKTTLFELIETGPVFSQVRDTWCAVITLGKSPPNEKHEVIHKQISRYIVSAEERLRLFADRSWSRETTFPQRAWLAKANAIVGYRSSIPEQKLCAKIDRQNHLGDLSEFQISRGEEGSKFDLAAPGRADFFMVLPEHVERYSVQSGIPYDSRRLTTGKVRDIYSRPKLWIVRIQKMRWKRRLVCGIDLRRDSAGLKTLQSIVHSNDDMAKLKLMQAILASSLVNWWCENYLADDMNKSYLEKLPVAMPGVRRQKQYERICQLVEIMLDLNDRLETAKTGREQIQRAITATDQQIDQLVYQLYELTPEEIALIESATTTTDV